MTKDYTNPASREDQLPLIHTIKRFVYNCKKKTYFLRLKLAAVRTSKKTLKCGSIFDHTSYELSVITQNSRDSPLMAAIARTSATLLYYDRMFSI